MDQGRAIRKARRCQEDQQILKLHLPVNPSHCSESAFVHDMSQFWTASNTGCFGSLGRVLGLSGFLGLPWASSGGRVSQKWSDKICWTCFSVSKNTRSAIFCGTDMPEPKNIISPDGETPRITLRQTNSGKLTFPRKRLDHHRESSNQRQLTRVASTN